jgi:DNA-binding helix-hairpin-helix protein with protein kinase domain
MSAAIYTGLNGVSYAPGRKVGQGGEGIVYEVQSDAGLVIKIYNHELTRERIDKLTHMAAISSPELNKFAAWPLDVVTDNTGKACGFTMRKLVAFVPLHMLFSPMERKKLFADKGYNYLVHVARNLAMAFYKIHQMGIIIGDVNEANILVNPNGMVAMIDCDSFQVKNGKRYHFCEVGVPRYTPPELLEKGSFTNVVRTVNTDAFSLATLIFQLLFLGRAPFTGINQSKEEIDEEKAIRTKEFAYSLKRSNKKLLPAKHSLSLKKFPQGTVKLFHQAFEEVSHRPTPKDWVIALDELNKQLEECTSFKVHQYPKTMQECPWCRFKAEDGITFFLDDTYVAPVQHLTDIDRFVNGFKPEKLSIKKLSENYAIGTLTAAPIDKKFYNLKKKSWLVYGAIGVVTVIASLFIGWMCILGGLIAILLSNLFFPSQLKLKEELNVRQKKFDGFQNYY